MGLPLPLAVGLGRLEYFNRCHRSAGCCSNFHRYLKYFVSSGDIWSHLASTVLPNYIMNSFWLMIGVGSGVFLIGVGSAWLVTMCSFPGSKHFQWLLILPMAVPAYLLAYTYTDFLAFTGPVQDTLRSITGWGYGDYWFPDVRSLVRALFY